MHWNAFPTLWLRQLINLCRKEFLVILKDPASRVVLFAPILMQTLIFGYVANFDLKNIPYALIDQSHSAAAGELVQHLDGSGLFQRVATLPNADAVREQIDRQRALLIISIAPDFAARLNAGEPAPLQIILDARNTTTAASAAAAVQSIVAQFNQDWRVRHGGSARTPITIETRAWFNPNLESRLNILPALVATLSMLQTILLTAFSVAREREQGTFDQLLVTPYRPLDIMLGKVIPPVTIGLAQAAIVTLVIRLWFGIPLAGSVGTLWLGVLLFLLAAVGFGLLVSAFSLNMQQAMLYSFVALMPMILLSGLMTPVRNMPAVLQWLTVINPVRFAIDWTRRVYLEGAGLMELRGDALVLLLISAITLPIASWLFRHRLN